MVLSGSSLSKRRRAVERVRNLLADDSSVRTMKIFAWKKARKYRVEKEELYSISLLKLWQCALDFVEGRGSKFRPYWFIICRRAFLDMRNAKENERKLFSSLDLFGEGSDWDEEYANYLEAGGLDLSSVVVKDFSDDLLLRMDLRKLRSVARKVLTKKEYHVFYRMYFEDGTREEIAGELRCRKTAVDYFRRKIRENSALVALRRDIRGF